MNTIIIGAGITGLSCAYHLKDDYIIFEREEEPGGLCRSIKKNGFVFDYTGHFLHLHTDYGKKIIMKLMKKNLCRIERNSWIYSHNVYTHYPFQVNLSGLPKKTIKECISDFTKAYYESNRYQNRSGFLSFRDWATGIFGRGLCKNFFFPYNKKLWRISLDKLGSDWVRDFIPQPSPEEILNGTVTDYRGKLGYNTYFYYPKQGGIGSLVGEFVKNVGNLHLNSQVEKINLKKKYIIVGKEKIKYENLISTMPLPELLSIAEDLPKDLCNMKDRLNWNSVQCMNIGIKRNRVLKNKHWIYFPEKKFVFYRVGIYSNICKNSVPDNCSSMYVEFSHKNNEVFDRKEVLEKVIRSLEENKILCSSEEITVVDILNIPYAYVIYDKDRNFILKAIHSFLNKNNIYSIGRFGAWEYSYIEESILHGKNIAEKIKNGKN